MPRRKADRPAARVVVRKIQNGRWVVFAPSGLIGSCVELGAAVTMAESAAEAKGIGLLIETDAALAAVAVVKPAPMRDEAEEQEDDHDEA